MSEQPTDIHAFPLPITQRVYTPEETASLVERVRKVAPDPTIFDEESPFFFGAEVSNANLDSYFTHQLPSSLQNYARDAEEGVSFQDSHQWRELGLGRTLTGKYHDGRGGKRKATTVDIYTLPGLQLNRLNTDHFIRGVRSGIAADVSIGFYGGAFLCDLCGRDMMTDWDCWHVPGLYYKAGSDEERGQWQARVAELMELAQQTAWTRKKGDKEEELILCTAGVDNGRLSEVSSVYDGACPGAAVLKATREVQEGRLRDARQIELLQNRYRIHLPAPRVQVPVGLNLESATATVTVTDNVPGAGDGGSPDLNTAAVPDEARRAQILQEALQAHGISQTLEQLRGALQAADDTLAEVNGLRQRVADLEAQAEAAKTLVEDGKKLRAELIERALKEGVRANGNAFDVERMRKRLEASTLEDIEGDYAMWQAAARQTFAGGRRTVDTPGVKDKDVLPRQPWRQAQDGQEETSRPNAAYRL